MLRLGLAFPYSLYEGKYITLNANILHLKRKRTSHRKTFHRHWKCKRHVTNQRHHPKHTRQSSLCKNTWRWSLFRTFIASFTARSWFRLTFQRLSSLLTQLVRCYPKRCTSIIFYVAYIGYNNPHNAHNLNYNKILRSLSMFSRSYALLKCYAERCTHSSKTYLFLGSRVFFKVQGSFLRQ